MSFENSSLILNLKDSFKIHKTFQKTYPNRGIVEPYQYDKSISVGDNLNSLALNLLNDASTTCILHSYRPIIIELVTRLITNENIEKEFIQSTGQDFQIRGSITLNALAKVIKSTGEIANLLEFFLERAQISNQMNQNQNIDEAERQLVLLAFYRLLTTDRQKFYKFIDPNFLHLMVKTQETSHTTKFLSILILSIYFQFSEETKTEMIQTYVDQTKTFAYFEGDANMNYMFIELLEAKRVSNLSVMEILTASDIKNEYCIEIFNKDITPGVSIVAGVMLTNLLSLGSGSALSSSEVNFVEIDKSVMAIKELAVCIQSSKPVMLVGKSGSGKTFLIDELAKFVGMDSNNIIKIHLNQQTDSKLLLGSYSSGKTPGSFEWKSGVLTTAVKEGRWVLVEDIDKAPNEVLSILLSLLENKELTIPSRGEVIKAANGFQLISTIRNTNNDSRKALVPDLIGLRLWNKVELQELDFEDLQIVIDHKYPLLKRFSKLFIQCFLNVKKMYGERRFISMNKGSQPRIISVRDLMKFCHRCNFLLQTNNIKTIDDFISDEIYDLVFQEAVDCFTSSVVERVPIESLTIEIGQSLEIPTSRINLHIARHVPVLQDSKSALTVGRAFLEKEQSCGPSKVATGNTTSFARTNHSLRLMEKVGVGISMGEPLLLVGETGTGKTTIVQQLAKLLNKKLTVINVSQQTEVGDLLGGFKPINAKTFALPILEEYEELFAKSFSLKKENNAAFVKMITGAFTQNKWKKLIMMWKKGYKAAETTHQKPAEASQKRRKLNQQENTETPRVSTELMLKWNAMLERVLDFEKQLTIIENSFVFKFVEGSVVKAVRNGDWLLLDEINLAAPETLDSISDLLSENMSQRNVLLSERGDIESIKCHPDFRIFGCMNPATDVGKKDLPVSIRSRFTEIYVHSPDSDISDLLKIIDKYIGKYAISDEWVGNDIAELYIEAKKLSDSNQIVDGANQKPHFSIRTLTRTLIYARDIISIYGLRRSLYEGFCMSFLTLLDGKSEEILKPIIEKHTIGRLKNANAVISQRPPNPSDPGRPNEYVNFEHYWMKHGPEVIEPQPNYILTPFVKKNMLNLVRATSGRRFPVLIQGPTSSGKTSMIKYLAKITGHNFVRINNHEHTDLQEYLGTYVSDETGKLKFKEGILVEALKKGHWIVLDELNLAPTDVLEALNRLLDDNRELFIPETQEIVRPHPDFMLFATQNPPGLYGGRKVLSKAFRNRFLELHFDDIPQDELETILKDRCKIPESYAKKIVQVYQELSIQRQSTRLFEQKNSFATLRDLFRWALREAVGYEQLAANGYMLLGERVRRQEEKAVVKQVLEKVMRVKLDMDAYYQELEIPELLQLKGDVVWTKAMRRLAVLVTTSMRYNEPLLLVGETGCGKTTVCQLIAQFYSQELIIVNAHQNTETGDLLGSQRPIRNRSELQAEYLDAITEVLKRLQKYVPGLSSSEIVSLFESISGENLLTDEEKSCIKQLKTNLAALFEWSDGPLINALKTGSYFLLDEISLADDSVLERLNSVLEPERSLLLAEKGTVDSFITAADGFQFLATMNPGGDYGKKELSPALRNRFTEIWVPSMEDLEDVEQIVSHKLASDIKFLAKSIVGFSDFFGKKLGGGSSSNGVISLRDILAWVTFINAAVQNGLSPDVSLVQGASMVFIDALGTNNTAFLAENKERLEELKAEFVTKLSELSNMELSEIYQRKAAVSLSSDSLICGDFSIHRRDNTASTASFNLQAPTTAHNAMRVIRAMQVHKPILLEGSPGVGKTSLISALAQATGNHLTRINLSEQTDLIDLFGSDAPVEGGEAGEFVWRDAPFLRAMQRGEWVLLDEMNLASQSVLEGLNACLDHRGEAYIPELDKSFKSHPEFLVFAAQNPQYQGGGRKGLPKSFVNRFSVVYVNMLEEEDLQLIAGHIYPSLDSTISSRMISFISKLEEEVVVKKAWGASGGPWEFNLRDTLRWLSLLNTKSISQSMSANDFFDMIIVQRFRTQEDRTKATELFEQFFGKVKVREPFFLIGKDFVQCKQEILTRRSFIHHIPNHSLLCLQSNIDVLETMFRCINHAWPMILVGPSNSGKTELIRYTAGLVGAKLYEFSMNSDIDSMDILGGFEQSDISRELAEVSNDIVEILLQIISEYFRNTAIEWDYCQMIIAVAKSLMMSQVAVETFPKLISQLKELGWFSTDEVFSSAVLEERRKLSSKRITDLQVTLSSVSSVKFKWFDGLLVQAVEKGHWLILDNANLCSPSVLDRLNSLLEFGGSLIINECTQVDGTPRVITPHPNFRLFLTSDPKYGELSRAMRNRGVEIYLNPLRESLSSFDVKNLGLSQSEPIPVTGLISSYDSQTRSLSLILDSVSGTTNLSGNSVAAVTSLNSVEGLKSLFKETLKSSDFNESDSLNIDTLLRKLSVLKEFCFLDEIFELSSISESAARGITHHNIAYAENQLIHPLVNSYTIDNFVDKVFINTTESSYFFEVVSFIADADSFMQMLRNKAESMKISEMSYIERSAAVHFGRDVKRETRLKIYQFANEIYLFIRGTAKLLIEDDTVWTKMSVFEHLHLLCILWKNMVEQAAVESESKLRVYQQKIIDWSQRAEELYSADSLKVVKLAIKKFSEKLNLFRGTSMTIIWESFRRAYPSSENGWINYEKLILLSEEFDSVAKLQFHENFEVVNEMRSMIIVLFEDCIKSIETDEFTPLCDDLANKVALLKDISSKFLDARSNQMILEYESLLNFVDMHYMVSGDSIPLTAENKILFLQAGRSTYSMIRSSQKELFAPFPRIFDNLWMNQNNKYVSQLDILLNDSLFRSLFSHTQKLKLTSGNRVVEHLEDVNLFASAIIKNSTAVLDDQLGSLSKILIKWIVKMLDVHLSSLKSASVQETLSYIHNVEKEGISSSSLAKLLTSIENDELKAFSEIANMYFIPSLLMLTGELNKMRLGKAWILTACGFIQLYVPSSAYDPAIEEHIEYDNFLKLKNLITSISTSWRSTRAIISGDGKIKVDYLLDDMFHSSEPANPRVFRSEASLDQLFDEWFSFVDTSLDDKHIDILLKASDEFSDNSSSIFDNFQQNSSQFISRLSTKYSRYQDLNDIFIGYVYTVKVGAELIRSHSKDSISSPTSVLWPVNLSVVSSFSTVLSIFDELKKAAAVVSHKLYDVEKVYVYCLQLFSYHKRLSSNQEVDSLFANALMTLYYRWSLRQMEKEKQDAADNNMFKYADAETDIEKDFQRLFPDAEDEIQVSLSENSKVSIVPDEVYSSIAEEYINAFGGEATEYDIGSLISKGNEVIQCLKNIYKDDSFGSNNSPALASLIVELSNAERSFKDVEDQKNVDFYKGYSPYETKKAGVVVNRLRGSVYALLQQWPEHATLQHLFRNCTEFLEFSSSTPVYRLLTKVEQLYTYLGEWEKYAHSGVSLKDHISTLSSLIVSWRKLELVSWRQVFTNEENVIRAAMGKWWFHLFESLIVPAANGALEEEEEQVRVLSAINLFFSQSTYGEFEYRLSLIKAFVRHIQLLVPDSLVAHSLLNVITFYAQFSSVINEFIQSNKKDLEKKLSEIILLASWKDINIDALKQSSRRSHHNLYKVIRKYRDLLNQPITSIIESGVSSSTKVSVSKRQIRKYNVSLGDNFNDLIVSLSQISSWDERPQRLKNIGLIHKNMNVYYKGLNEESIPSIYEFAKDVVEQAEHLRKETPGTATEENKKLCASLKTEKRKLFSDTISELKRAGLRLQTTSDVSKVLSSVTSVLATSKSLENSFLNHIDGYFFRLLDLMPRLRASVHELNEEIPVSDAHKALAAGENLIFSLVARRESLLTVAKLNSSLEEKIASFETLNSVDTQLLKCSLISHTKLSREMVASICANLPKVLSYALDSLSASSKFTRVSYDGSVFSQALNHLQNLTVSRNSILTTENVEEIQSVRTYLVSFIDKVLSWKKINTSVGFIADLIIGWIDSQHFELEVLSNTSMTTIGNLENVEVAFRDLLTSILVSVQKVFKLKEETGSLDEEKDKWFSLSQRKLQRYADALYPLRIQHQLDKCVKAIELVEHNENTSRLVSCVVVHSSILLKHYSNICSVILNQMTENYIKTSHATYMLCNILHKVAKEGFCSPEPPNDQKDSGNMQDGTGLGDGDGATNNSKDVEDDEDLSEQAQQPNQEDKEKDDGNDEDDDAVDIEGDMAGNLENAPPEDEDGEKDEKDQEEEEELDEEVDDLDDMDPNAVDEKMWDEEAKEDTKEKESDEMPNDSKANDDMEGVEDQEESKEQNPKKEDDAQTQEDSKDEDQKNENDDNAEEEEDVGEQDDEVRNDEEEQADANIPEAEVLDLPEDINLDSDKEGDDDGEEAEDGGFDDKLDENDKFEDDEKVDEDAKMSDVDMNDEEDLNNDENDQEAEGKANESEEGENNDEDEAEEGYDDGKDENGEGEDNESLMDVDENDQQGKEEDEQKEEEEESNNVEGVDGLEDGANDDVDADAAVQQQGGAESEGADADVKEEQDNMGASGGASTTQEQQEDKQEEQTNDSSREQAKESLKELGDSLKEFYRRRQEIKEATDEDMVDQQSGERPDEFQHLNGENTENDTQALGAANKDQIQSLDDDKAIDDDEEQQPEESEEKQEFADEDVKQDLQDKDEEMDVQDAQEQDGEFNGQTKATLGERKRDFETLDDEFSTKMDVDQSADESDDELDDYLGKLGLADSEELRPYQEAQQLWAKSDVATQELTAGLCEQLRLILEPTLSTKLRGDYKTGKRLNMKRIIPYIASQFRKDKIWMRRTKPSKRQYQIMIAVDDSKSMEQGNAVDIAFESIALVSKALTQLESGQLSIVKFGEKTTVVHPFEKPFSSECGVRVFQSFKFDETKTDVERLVSSSLKLFSDARTMGDSDLWQLQIILSDGVCGDHATVQRLVRQAREEKVMLVFVVIDGVNNKESILNMTQANFIKDAYGNTKLQLDRYLDTFPFEFYVVVNEVAELPEMLALILRQYFSELASS